MRMQAPRSIRCLMVVNPSMSCCYAVRTLTPVTSAECNGQRLVSHLEFIDLARIPSLRDRHVLDTRDNEFAQTPVLFSSEYKVTLTNEKLIIKLYSRHWNFWLDIVDI